VSKDDVAVAPAGTSVKWRGVLGETAGHWKFTWEADAKSSGAATPFMVTCTPARLDGSGYELALWAGWVVNPVPVRVAKPPGVHVSPSRSPAAFDSDNPRLCEAPGCCG